MRRTGRVVAERHRGVVSQENCAGARNFFREFFRVLRRNMQMLRGDEVRPATRVVGVPREATRPEICERLPRSVAAFNLIERFVDLGKRGA